MSRIDHLGRVALRLPLFVVLALGALLPLEAAFADIEEWTEVEYGFDEWNIIAVEVEEEFLGFFAWVQPEDTSTYGTIAMWYGMVAEGEWDPWVYTGSDLGAAVIEAEQVFLGEPVLRTNPHFTAAVAATLEDEESELPAETYVSATNGMFGAGTDRSGFPQYLTGTTATATLGFVAPTSELEPCECDVVVPQEGMSLLALELNELWIDYTGVENSSLPTVAMFNCDDWWWSGPRSCPAWGAWGPWVLVSETGFHLGNDIWICTYDKKRTRICSRSQIRFCFGPYIVRKTFTEYQRVRCQRQGSTCPAQPDCL